MTRAELPSQFSSNGHKEPPGLPPKGRKLFVSSVAQSLVPDIDTAREILPTVPEFYGALGVPQKDRQRIAKDLENKLYEGTAGEQADASEALLRIKQTHDALKETFTGSKKIR